MFEKRTRLLILLVLIAISAGLYASILAGPKRAPLPEFISSKALTTGGIVESKDAPDKVDEQTQTVSPPSVVVQQAPEPETPESSANTQVAPVKSVEDITRELDGLTKRIDSIDQTVSTEARDDAFLAQSRGKIEEVIEKANKKIAILQPRLDDVDSQIKKLGPEPKEDEPAETDQVKDERKRLAKAKSEIAGAIKTSGVLKERSRQLAGKLQDLRQALFAQAILARGRSPLFPSLWADVGKELPSASRQLGDLMQQWGKRIKRKVPDLILVLFFSVVIFEILRRAAKWFRHSKLNPTTKEQSFFQKALAAIWVVPSFALPALIAGAVLYFGLDYLRLMTPFAHQSMQVLLSAGAVVVMVWALARAILQPTRPAWRMVNVPDKAAHRVAIIFTALVAVYGVDLVLQHLMKTLYMSLPVRVAEAAIVTLASAALLFVFVRTPLASQTPHGASGFIPSNNPLASSGQSAPSQSSGLGQSTMAPRILKWPALLLALFMSGSVLIGYVALGHFVSGQILVFCSLVVALILIQLAIRAFTRLDGNPSEQPLKSFFTQSLNLADGPARLLTSIISAVLQFTIPLLAVPFLFLSWGYSVDDATAWIKSLLFGFQIGQFRISLVEIAVAAGIFIIALFATRVLQRWVTTRALPPGRVDNGVANSIHTTIGYIGFVLATLAAVSYAGFDVTNLAIVAGALSIGVGFGLQSIVNNFVSGLIILFERPIKVGDWVSVDNYEGYVRRISVRSTEIETFDRTNVIVPNSEFISKPIVNLTHRNALGRIVIPIGVSYKSDPELVRDLLLKVAKDSPDILEIPNPVVSFDNFGASSLDFSVRAYIADVNTKLSASSSLRMRIFKALAEAGIEIPFPQHDINLRDLDPVRSALQSVALKQAMKSSGVANGKAARTKPEPEGQSGGIRYPNKPNERKDPEGPLEN